MRNKTIWILKEWESALKWKFYHNEYFVGTVFIHKMLTFSLIAEKNIFAYIGSSNKISPLFVGQGRSDHRNVEFFQVLIDIGQIWKEICDKRAGDARIKGQSLRWSLQLNKVISYYIREGGSYFASKKKTISLSQTYRLHTNRKSLHIITCRE